MILTTFSPSETEAVGAALAKTLTPGTVIAYKGDLGAGKTAFTRGLARGLGCTEQVTSPTYTIVNEYLSANFPKGREIKALIKLPTITIIEDNCAAN